jgi:hypothetical protein
VAAGMASFGVWPVRIAAAGTYRIEVRRWPRELDAPTSGVPSGRKTPDAYLNDKPIEGTLYPATPRALPVKTARLKVGDLLKEANCAAEDTAAVFTVELEAGPVDLEARLLDQHGKPLCGAYFVYVRRQR